VKDIWTILGFLGRRVRALLPFLVLLEVVAALAESFGVGLLIPFTEAVFGEHSFGAMQGPLLKLLAVFGEVTGTSQAPALLGLFIVGFILLKTLLWSAYITATQWIKEEAVHRARCAILRGLMRADYGRYSKRDVGDYQSVIATDSWRVAEGIGSFFHLLGRAAVVLVFAVILCILSWRLLVFSGLVFILASFLIRVFSRRAKAHAEQAWSANWRLASRMLSVLSGMRTVRLFRQEEREIQAFSRHSSKTRKAYFAHSVFQSLVGPILESIYIPFFVLLVLGAHMAGMQMALLVAFLVLMYRMVPHLRGLEEARVSVTGSMPSVKAMVQLIQSFPDEPDANKTQVTGLTDAIVFDGVGFDYQRGDAKAFGIEDVSFAIKPGTTVALVGASGSGKSTLVNLLLGFYTPNRGQISIDGIPYGALDLASFRGLIGFAGQDSQLFPGTIADNIAYGKPEASRAEIEEVARRADVMEFAERLAQGLDTEISREGLDLSGGQRQRIALARALLVEPQILLLDEATNALDNVTEHTIQRMLAELAHKTTTIIVAHRMSTIRHADWIIAMDQGRVAEQGRPADLIRKNAAFARLYRLEQEVAFSGADQTDSRK
jgi:ABC-type multidrug transport system fused ATPase/permease subunit